MEQKNNRDRTGFRRRNKKPIGQAIEIVSETFEDERAYADDINFLKDCPASAKEAIVQRMQKTFLYRQYLVKKNLFTFEKFPRFLDTPGLVKNLSYI